MELDFFLFIINKKNKLNENIFVWCQHISQYIKLLTKGLVLKFYFHIKTLRDTLLLKTDFYVAFKDENVSLSWFRL